MSDLKLAAKTLLGFLRPNSDLKGWKTRDLTSAKHYFSTKDSPSNVFLWSKLNLENANTILEIGSNSGNRIFKLAQENSSKRFFAIDINPHAVEYGNAESIRQGLSNLEFLRIDLRSKDFETFLQKYKFDVVFSWACLMYIHPIKIWWILRVLLQSSSRLVIIEQNEDKLPHKLVWGGTNWRHNYCLILERIAYRMSYAVSIDKHEVPTGIWNPGGGNATAFLVSKTAR